MTTWRSEDLDETTGDRPRRCCLSVPGTDPGMIDKAVRAGADEVVVDLEDSVPPQGKEAARKRVMEWLAAADAPGVSLAVRVNPPGSPWCHADLESCAHVRGVSFSVVLPKVETVGDLAFADRLLSGAEAAAGRAEPLALQALVETAAGLSRATEIAAGSVRLRAMILGYADLAASLGRGAESVPGAWLPSQHAVLTAARAAGIAALDGPHLGVGTGDDFSSEVKCVAGLGFDGKWVIHPRQVSPVIAAFTPDADEVRNARQVLDALATAHRDASGAVELDGRMIDEAVAVAARRTLAKAGVA
ncbi:CoA ester lyase [Saccharopolyspora sp. TS4A08]|uniref:CoA ester lyase n=1 Tax=Saccharopolyspora ipomoeae TaxID=3042027 RepID=A0ABT6PQG8_9PSEU|nr:CoA ester lyase [Saccharopolyspora sp. TS4A08]MDI2030235.1 CoA ester lyase [Saccharopolyspora sp. TS4A08]